MASIDIEDRRDESGYVAVYPITTRHLAASIAAFGFTSGTPGNIWPPYTAGAALVVMNADDLGYGQEIFPDGFTPTTASNMYIRYQIGHEFGPTPYFWVSATNTITVQKWGPDGFGNLNEVEGLLYFDLAGVPEGWTSVELVVTAQATGDANGRSIVAGYHDTYAVHSGGTANRSDPDDLSSWLTVPYGGGEPIMYLSEYSYGTQNAGNSIIPATPLGALSGDPSETIWPLADDGNWGKTFRGIRLSLTGGAPSGDNTVVLTCDFSEMATLPHLRFLYDTDVVTEIPVSVTIPVTGLEVSARARVIPGDQPDRRILEHKARQHRGW